jgi:hypothetical protein
MIESKRMKCAGRVAHVGEIRNTYIILVGKPKAKRPLGTRRPDWRIILKWFLWKYGRSIWTGFICLM